MDFDAIVVGSGMSGGWAAKELCERGLKTLVIERGQHVTHGEDYLDYKSPWELENFGRISEEELARDYPIQKECYAFTTANKRFWVKDSDHPYITPEGRPFHWLRGYHLGGRSLLWARHSYRWSDLDYEANSKDGHGVDWPIRYADTKPWYDHVERFAGISGSKEGIANLPDGEFLPAMELNVVEKAFKHNIESHFPGRKLIMGRVAHLTQPTEEQDALGRGACQYRDFCYRGCSFGAYFSSLSATLPAAQRTNNLTIVTDAIGHSVIYDPATGRASGVRVIDQNTKQGRTYTARIVFLCASAIGSAQIMLNSTSDHFPTGIPNKSNQVGRNLMDHICGIRISGTVPGYEDRYYAGRRPAGFYIPRYRNLHNEQGGTFVRGFGFQGGASREDWQRGGWQAGVGEDLKTRLREPGKWTLSMSGFAEMLPHPDNRVTLHATKKDKWGIPLLVIDCIHRENDQKLIAQAFDDGEEMFKAMGCTDISVGREEGAAGPGFGIHEAGTARMGRDPATSVLNGWNQAHDVQNLFVTDGACFASGACQNPSLSYMALSARAANHAADLMQQGAL